MTTHELIETMVVTSLVVVPALAVSARFALKPIVDAILRLREGGVLPGADDAATHQLAGQVMEMRGELAAMQRQIADIKEAADFHRALQQPAAPALPSTKSEHV